MNIIFLVLFSFMPCNCDFDIYPYDQYRYECYDCEDFVYFA